MVLSNSQTLYTDGLARAESSDNKNYNGHNLDDPSICICLMKFFDAGYESRIDTI